MSLGLTAAPTWGEPPIARYEDAAAAALAGDLLGNGTEVASHPDRHDVRRTQRPDEQLGRRARDGVAPRLLAALVGDEHDACEPEARDELAL